MTTENQTPDGYIVHKNKDGTLTFTHSDGTVVPHDDVEYDYAVALYEEMCREHGGALV